MECSPQEHRGGRQLKELLAGESTMTPTGKGRGCRGICCMPVKPPLAAIARPNSAQQIVSPRQPHPNTTTPRFACATHLITTSSNMARQRLNAAFHT